MPSARWTMIILCCLANTINYIDRANLAVAAPIMQRELGFDSTTIGFILSGFFWTYAVMQTRSRKVEMPNGLSLPLAFGMYTLLIGSGRYVSCLSASASSPSHRCTPYASMSAKSCPSTPGAPLLERHWA